MAHFIEVNGFLLDESSGEFKSDDGRDVKYHNARFYDTDDKTIFKASVNPKATLPEPQQQCVLVFSVLAGERYCKLRYESYEG